MKRVIRLLGLMMVFALLVGVSAPAMAVTPRASTYISSYTAYIERNSGFEFTIWFEILGNQGIMDEVGAYYVQLQKSTDGKNWSVAKNYYAEDYPSMIAENTAAHAGSLTYTGTNGYHYRANVGFYASKDGGSDRIFLMTSPVYIANGNGGRAAEE